MAQMGARGAPSTEVLKHQIPELISAAATEVPSSTLASLPLIEILITGKRGPSIQYPLRLVGLDIDN